MFDTYVTKPANIHVTEHREVTEKRAPTDESVRLLREMERAAEDKLVEVLRIKSNKFEAKAYVFRDEPCNTTRARLIFFLNDEKHDFYVEIDETTAREAMISKIREAIVQELADVLLQSITSNYTCSVMSPRPKDRGPR